jgi:ligand-binding SRPBCC domain-containing protein
MPTIVVETRIAAPIELCFDLARDVGAHARSAAATGERIVGPKTTGCLELGDEVTFEARHLGIRQRLTSRIVEFSRPTRFVDQMVTGAFTSLRHVHEFMPDGAVVVMRDTLTWQSPLGRLGALADSLFLVRYMRNFLVRKQSLLKAEAEHESR